MIYINHKSEPSNRVQMSKRRHWIFIETIDPEFLYNDERDKILNTVKFSESQDLYIYLTFMITRGSLNFFFIVDPDGVKYTVYEFVKYYSFCIFTKFNNASLDQQIMTKSRFILYARDRELIKLRRFLTTYPDLNLDPNLINNRFYNCIIFDVTGKSNRDIMISHINYYLNTTDF